MRTADALARCYTRKVLDAMASELGPDTSDREGFPTKRSVALALLERKRALLSSRTVPRGSIGTRRMEGAPHASGPSPLSAVYMSIARAIRSALDTARRLANG